jgi:small-conductance mechanosensitive channel
MMAILRLQVGRTDVVQLPPRSRYWLLHKQMSGARRNSANFMGAVMSRLGWSNLTAAAIVMSMCAVLRAQSGPPPLPDASKVMAFLNQTITWYRHLGVEEQLADQPTDILFVYNNHQTANEVLRLSFDFARADAHLLSSQNPTAPQSSAGTNPSQNQNLAQLASKAADSLRQKQQKLDALKQKLPAAGGTARTVLQSKIEAAQSDLGLAQTRSDLLNSLVQFSNGSESTEKASGGLLAQISELEQSVPEARTTSTAMDSAKNQSAQSNSTAPNTMPVAQKTQPSGILGLGSDLLSLRQKIRTLNDSLRMTDALYSSSRTLLSPLGATLREALREDDDLANQPAPTNLRAINQRKQQIDTLESQFKHVSTAAVPLAEQGILLERYKANLTTWRNTLESERRTVLRNLMVRLVTLGVILLLAIGLFEIWRRVTFHYIHELRRRNQFLLLRRIVMFVSFAIILALGFSTDFGSLTTFAGLLAAGLAVCLQSVILSVLGYFVLLGKYGIRVGDRIQISGVTGNVVDIDLMRLSLMELGESGSGSDLVPTGRTVEFPNAIVFQPTAGLFKQIPGANFLWHEVTLTLSAEGDYRVAQSRMMEAVEGVFSEYREKLELQHQRMERTLNLPIDMPRPQSRLRFMQNGLEVTIRYPVTREKAADIDDRITRALLDVMDEEPRVKSVGSPEPSMPPPTAGPSSNTQSGPASARQ